MSVWDFQGPTMGFQGPQMGLQGPQVGPLSAWGWLCVIRSDFAHGPSNSKPIAINISPLLAITIGYMYTFV